MRCAQHAEHAASLLRPQSAESGPQIRALEPDEAGFEGGELSLEQMARVNVGLQCVLGAHRDLKGNYKRKTIMGMRPEFRIRLRTSPLASPKEYPVTKQGIIAVRAPSHNPPFMPRPHLTIVICCCAQAYGKEKYHAAEKAITEKVEAKVKAGKNKKLSAAIIAGQKKGKEKRKANAEKGSRKKLRR